VVIEEVKTRMPLEVVRVLAEPPQEWAGERGFIDQEVLDRHLSENYGHYEYFISGPTAMMDLTESILRKKDLNAVHLHRTLRHGMVFKKLGSLMLHWYVWILRWILSFLIPAGFCGSRGGDAT
jgi:NAD(P)H-flavin reductase